jgi:hypothetical protein
MGLLAQNQEGCLENIFRIVLILEGSKSDAQDHRPVTANDGCKRRLIAPAQETLEQLLVGLCAKFKGACDLSYVANQTILQPFFHSRVSKLEQGSYRFPIVVLPPTETAEQFSPAGEPAVTTHSEYKNNHREYFVYFLKQGVMP